MGKRKRQGDENDEGVRQRAGAFQWATLILTNFGPIKALVILILGAGTAYHVPAVKNFVNGGSSLPIPKGQVVTPDATQTEAFRAQLIQSLESITAAVDGHTEEITALRKDMSEANKAARNESSAEDLKQNQRLDALEELVQ